MKYMNIKQLNKFFAAVLVAIAVMAGGCSDKEQQTSQTAAKEQQKTAVLKPKEEIFGDEDIFNAPRIQFVYTAKDGTEEIWSCKLDGSDVRVSVDSEFLLLKGATGFANRQIMRSPDNRYIVASMYANDTIEKHLFDLKTKTKTVIMEGGMVPHFAWTPDSKHVLFYSDPGLMDYNVETGELKTRKWIQSYGFYIIESGEFVAVLENGLQYYAPDGETKTKFVELIDENMKNKFEKLEIRKTVGDDGHYMTADGKYFMYYLVTGFTETMDTIKELYVIDMADPSKTLHSITNDKIRWIIRGFIPPQVESIYYSAGAIFDIKSQKVSYIKGLDEIMMKYMSIFNTRGSK